LTACGVLIAWLGASGASSVAGVVGTALAAITGLTAIYRALRSRIEVDGEAWKPANRRRHLARHMTVELKALADAEDWTDDKYAELEAEVEMEGGQRRRLTSRTSYGPRRMKSLSAALENSADRLIILEGEPGSGKSIALRHVALHLARIAEEEKGASRAVIPLYVNLKGFRPEGPVNSSAVRDYVKRAINTGSNSEVEDALENLFTPGLLEGLWIFLFDSFDEIPAILGSVDSDSVVQEYSDAIQDFMISQNDCRAVVASREFRGPHQLGWTRFRVLRLTTERQHDLIDRSRLPKIMMEQLYAGLFKAAANMREASETPLFLNLLCQHMRVDGTFPQSSHEVFEDFVRSRLNANAQRIMDKHGIEIFQVRTTAEELAFAMASAPGLGLEADREELKNALPALLRAEADAVMSALVTCRLAKETSGSVKRFTFTHRRIQEYFTTCLILNSSNRVSLDQLLTDHNWREAAVTIMQTQSKNVAEPVITRASGLFEAAPPSTVVNGSFPWPKKSLHLLLMLAAGLGARPDWLADKTRKKISDLLLRAWQSGMRHDRKWVLEAVTVASWPTCLALIEQGFEHSSPMLQDEAYRQTSRLSEIPDSLSRHVRKGLVTQWAEGTLRLQSSAIKTEVRRLDRSCGLSAILDLLLFMPRIDLLLALCSSGAVLFTSPTARLITAVPIPTTGLAALLLVSSSRVSLMAMIASPEVSWSSESHTLRSLRWLNDYIGRNLGLNWLLSSYWGIGLFLRFFVGAIALASVWTSPDSSLWALTDTFLVLMYVIWSPFAISVIVSGTPVKRIQWPFLPTVAIWRGFTASRENQPTVSHNLDIGYHTAVAARKTSKMVIAAIVGAVKTLAVMVAAVAIGGGLLAGVYFFIIWLDPHAFKSLKSLGSSSSTSSEGNSGSGFHLTIMWLYVVGSMAAVAIIVIVVTRIFTIVKEVRREHYAKRSALDLGSSIEPAEMIEIFDHVRSDRTLRLILIELRRKGVFRQSPESLRFLIDLSRMAEVVHIQKNARPDDASMPVFQNWLKSANDMHRNSGALRNRFRMVRSLSDITLDEIARIVRESDTSALN
jgi:hypothetical protein